MAKPFDTFSQLSDQELLAEVRVAADREREATARLIALLAQLDARRLYLGEGCSSLFTYCTQVLRLSEHAAYGRIEAARAAREFPVVLDLLSDGSVTLTAVTRIEVKVLLDGAVRHGAIVEHETIAVRREDKRQLERLRVFQGLLHAVADAAVVVFCLDHSKRDVQLVVEDVVGALGFAPRDKLAPDDDPAFREADFLAKLRDLIPPGRGRDELGADVAFAGLLLVHAEAVSAPIARNRVAP